MRGQKNEDFITTINKEFICLIVTVIQHCLKAWSTGIHCDMGRFSGPMTKGDHHHGSKLERLS